MSVVLESRTARLRRLIEEQYAAKPTGCGASFGEILCHELHTRGLTFARLAEKWRVSLPTLGRLIADHCERLEEDPSVDHRYAAALAPVRAGIAKPRITLEPPAKKAPAAKPEPRPPQQRTGRKPLGDVSLGCGLRQKRPTVLLRLSETIGERLGLGPGIACDCNVEQLGKTLVVRAGQGLRAQHPHGVHQYLVRMATAERWGMLGVHPAEVCEHHFDSENRLVIQAPAWLKQPATTPPPAKAASQKTKAGPPVSCKKIAGTNSTIKCAACEKATATVECSLCPTLLCDGCWGDHVRTHWHTAVTRSTFTPDAATRSR